MKVFAGRASQRLAEDIASRLGVSLCQTEVTDFADGEFEPRILENIRGEDVFVVQSTYPPADNLMELVLWIDAAKRAKAEKIIAVIPYYGWGRGDRKARSGVPISAKRVANMLWNAGMDQLISLDLHSAQTQGFLDIPVDHLYVRPVFTEFIRSLEGFDPSNTVILGPDTNAAGLAQSYAKRLGSCGVAVAHKTRSDPNQVNDIWILGDVKGKRVFIVDDLIDTAGTQIEAAAKLQLLGATEINSFCAHGLFSANAVERIEASPISRVYVSDTIPLDRGGREIESSKISVISIAPLLAEVIRCTHAKEPLAPLFE